MQDRPAPRVPGVWKRLRRTRKEIARLVRQDWRALGLARRPLGSDAATLRREGFALLPGQVDARRCEGLRDSVEALVAGFDRSTELPDGVRVDIRNQDGRTSWDTGMIDVLHVDRVLPGFAELWKELALEPMLGEACGEPVAIERMNAYVSRGVTDTRRFHIDTISTTQYKAFVYLTDTSDVRDGPYMYVARSHRLAGLRYVNRLLAGGLDLGHARDTPLVRPRRVRTLTGRTGDLIISDQNGAHRGHPQAPERQRVVAVASYAPLPSPSREDLEAS